MKIYNLTKIFQHNYSYKHSKQKNVKQINILLDRHSVSTNQWEDGYVCSAVANLVGGKRYIDVYLLLHVYRLSTPPRKRFRTWRFSALTPCGVWQVVFSHPIDKHHSWLFSESVLFYAKESLFGHLTTKEPTGISHLLLYYTIWPFPISTRALGTMTTADFSWFVPLALGCSFPTIRAALRLAPIS